jgi:hypothetical protein
MDVEVVILAERSQQVLDRWWEVERSRVRSPGWTKLALDLVRRSRQGCKGRGEIYLCYRGEVGEFYDHELLERLVEVNREFTWGSEIYVVLDSSQPVPTDDASDYFGALDEWIETACRSGIHGFLQTKIDRSGLTGVEPALLRSACDRIRRLKKEFKKQGEGQAWEVSLLGEGGRIETYAEFLGSAAWLEQPRRSVTNVLIGICQPGKEDREAAIEELLRRLNAKRVIVATVGVRPDASLYELCTSRKLPLLWFRGFFELKFFLQSSRSDRAAGGRAPTTKALPSAQGGGPLNFDEFTSYEMGLAEMRRSIGSGNPLLPYAATLESRLKENIRRARITGDTEDLCEARARIVHSLNKFTTHALGQDFNPLCEAEGDELGTASPAERIAESLLLTISLDPEVEAELCLLAARAVGKILDAIPLTIIPRIHLAITCASLEGMIESESAIAGWIFIGRGLQDATSGELVQPSAWLACFLQHEKRSPMTMLVAGGSVETARHFIDSHCAQYAIGFNLLTAAIIQTIPNLAKLLFNGSPDRGGIETLVRQIQGEVFFAEG